MEDTAQFARPVDMAAVASLPTLDITVVRRASIAALLVLLFVVGLLLGLRERGFPGTHTQFEAPAMTSHFAS